MSDFARVCDIKFHTVIQVISLQRHHVVKLVLLASGTSLCSMCDAHGLIGKFVFYILDVQFLFYIVYSFLYNYKRCVCVCVCVCTVRVCENQ